MNDFTILAGGVTSPMGFSASGIHCGIRKNKDKKDLALIVSNSLCSASAVYTLNKVQGAPIAVTKEHLQNGMAKAVICNSGNANTCNTDGVKKAKATCQALADELKMNANDIIVASTGVIGQPLPLEPIVDGIPLLVSQLGIGPTNGTDAATAIMTTDTVIKEAAVSFIAGGKTCTIGAMAKGSGMIHPNMATMLCFITCDAAVSPAMLQQALSRTVNQTFNMVSVDGDTSTNDMVSILCSGQAGNPEITAPGEDFDQFTGALTALCTHLCRMIAKDGEGATKLLQCTVTYAPSPAIAKAVAKSVITSSLFKAAMFGEDANWGRALCAIGYTPGDFDINKVSVALSSKAGSVLVCQNGSGVDFSEKAASKILAQDEIIISVSLGEGQNSATAWGCDLTYDYVKINGSYRT